MDKIKNSKIFIQFSTNCYDYVGLTLKLMTIGTLNLTKYVFYH